MCKSKLCTFTCTCSNAFTDVMQYQQFFHSFQINQEIFFICFAKSSKSTCRKVHKNPWQTHKNVGTEIYLLCLVHSSSQNRCSSQIHSSSQNLLAVPKSRLRTHGDVGQDKFVILILFMAEWLEKV